jgi:hypothetical protein
MILVEFLNLTFDPEIDIKRVSNVKFIPLASHSPETGVKASPCQAAQAATRFERTT